MTLTISDLAGELLHHILRFCSQSDLASLSQVNSKFRKAAEYLLYRHIFTPLYPIALIPDKTWQSWAVTERSLFHTLASNPQKAALSKSLHVQFEFTGGYKTVQANCSVMGKIADALQNAHGLVDLRIMVDQGSDASQGRLSQAIMSGQFQLHTLYCDSCQDLDGIIATQTQLRLLGIYNAYDFAYLRQLLKNRYHNRIDCNRELPTIFLLKCPRTKYYLSQLTFFPEFYLPGQALSICRDIAISLAQDLGNRYDVAPLEGQCDFAIRIFNHPSPNAHITSCEVIEAIAQCFVDCRVFSIIMIGGGEGPFLMPWRVPGLSTSINQIQQLQSLKFYMPYEVSLRQLATDLRSFVLEELVHSCPTLTEVCLDDYSETVYMASGSGWEIVIPDNYVEEVNSSASSSSSDED